MKNNRKLSEALWSDCETDMERFQFLMSGRAFETGILAKAIQNEVALAFNYRAQMMACKSSPNVPVDLRRQAFDAGERYGEGMSDDNYVRWVRNVREQSAPSEMRGFTAEESESYSESLKKLGKSTGRTFQQSAPSVVSVPSEDELIFAFHDEYKKHKSGNRILHGIRAIHSLLTSRTEGK